MLLSKIEQSPNISVFIDRFSTAIGQAWAIVCKRVEFKIRDRIKDALSSGLLGHEFSANVTKKYSFLINLRGLIDNYISCIEVDIISQKKYSIRVYVNEDHLENLGLPRDLRDILEFGNEDLPNFPHFNKGIDNWVMMDSEELFRELDATVGKLMS